MYWLIKRDSFLILHVSFYLFMFHDNFVCLTVTAGIYSPNAYRGFAREFIKDLERIR